MNEMHREIHNEECSGYIVDDKENGNEIIIREPTYIVDAYEMFGLSKTEYTFWIQAR